MKKRIIIVENDTDTMERLLNFPNLFPNIDFLLFNTMSEFMAFALKGHIESTDYVLTDLFLPETDFNLFDKHPANYISKTQYPYGFAIFIRARQAGARAIIVTQGNPNGVNSVDHHDDHWMAVLDLVDADDVKRVGSGQSKASAYASLVNNYHSERFVKVTQKDIGEIRLTKTHRVLDEFYHKDEGNSVFVGTLDECNNFVLQQGENALGYKVERLTKEEMLIENGHE